MKYLYKALDDILANDSDLCRFAGHNDENETIRRAFAPDGEWNKLVIYYLQTDFPNQDFTSQIRTVPLIVRVYDRTDDLNIEDMAERIILLLEGSDLTEDGKVHAYNCSYAGAIISTSWNKDLKSFEKALRFMVTVRVDAITGNSGLPTRRRM